MQSYGCRGACCYCAEGPTAQAEPSAQIIFDQLPGSSADTQTSILRPLGRAVTVSLRRSYNPSRSGCSPATETPAMPENYDGCSSALPAAPSFAKIEEQYVTLMPDKVLEERPETTLAELRYLV